MNAEYALSEKRRVLAALQLGCDRAIKEQDVYRNKIDELPTPSHGMLDGILARIVEKDSSLLIDYFAGCRFPVPWTDREMFGVRKDSQDDPYNLSRRYQSQVEDKEIGLQIWQLNEYVEHRDRIALLARFYEFIGCRLDGAENLVGKASKSMQHLTFFRTLIIRLKEFEWLEGQAKELDRVEDESHFAILGRGMRYFLESMPESIAKDNCAFARIGLSG